MSSKPTVTLTLAGDEKKLTESFDRSEKAGDSLVGSIEQNKAQLASAFNQVGNASKQMGDKVSSSRKDFEDTEDGFDRLTEGADGAESKFMGFHDVLDGVKGGLETLSDPSASMTDKLIGLGQAGADVAGGLASFLIPALQSVWGKLTATTAAQWALTAAQTTWNGVTAAGAAAMKLLNAAFVSSPIGWVVLGIGALVAAFVILWNKSEGFRNFFTGMWNGIKTVVGNVISWIQGAWNNMTTFFSNLVTGIGNIFSGIGGAIKSAFKNAVNFVIGILNSVIGFFNKIIYGINLVNPFDDIPSIPKIPKMHTGGVVPGLPGQERVMVLAAGEEVSTSSQRGGGGGGTMTFGGDLDSALATLIMKLYRKGEIRLEG